MCSGSTSVTARIEEHLARFEAIRRVEHASGRPIAILADLQGPKLRLGTFADRPDRARRRRPFCASTSIRAPGDQARAPLPHPEIFAALQPGTDLLLDDGKVRLETESCGPGFAETLCRVGGPLSDRKGVNVPNAVLPLSAITDKDRADLAFALDHRRRLDCLLVRPAPRRCRRRAQARRRPRRRHGQARKAGGDRAAREIIELADGLMVARGDLGVEMPPEDVPSVQKQVVHACRLAGKPVIVATQMLESMIASPTPTRAEASDVATAVYEGADAVMLSAETAAGRYPIEAVAMMNRIACRVQQDPLYFPMLESTRIEHEHTAPDAISAAACQVADTVGAAAIVSYTTSGATALRAARERPGVPILVLTSNLGTARRLAVLWGAHCVHTSDVKSFADMVQKAVRIAHREEIAQAGQRVVVTAGVPFGTPGATNVLRIAWVER